MSVTATSTPRLSEFAKKFTYPQGIVKTVWPRVEAKGRELGLGFDWWQSQLGTVCLGYGEDGKYVATVGGIGMSIPRQVGKTYFVLALLVIMCILFPGLQVVWTAHHLRTSTKTFTSLRGICRRKKIAPFVRALRSANGEQQVEFANGSMVMFGARSMGFGRGFDEIDVEVFDEAQILDTKALEDMIAATNQSRHEHGALLFYMGTPPRKTDPSDSFRERRDEAWSGEAADAIWLEIGADPDSDPDDRDQWPVMNPSFPLRTPLESMLRLRKNLKDEDSWNREGRGIWDPQSSRDVIPLADWNDIADATAEIDGPISLGVDVAPDRKSAAVAFAGQTADGRWLVAMREHKKGSIDWVAPFVESFKARNKVRAVVVDKMSAAASLTDDLEKRKVRITLAQAQDMASACGQLYDGVYAGWLTHPGQPQLAAALAQARKRDMLAGGAWGWSKKASDSDITPVVAVTLALWGARHSQVRRNPNPNPNRPAGRGAGRRVVGRR